MDRIRLKALLTQHEARRTAPYDDKTGKTLQPGMTLQGQLTIGVGHNLTAKGLTAKQIDMILDDDIDEVIRDIERHFDWFPSLSMNRQMVVISMVFNLGIAKFLDFKRTIAAIARGEYADAATFMLESKWARQVGQRARTLADMMRRG